MQRSSKFIAYVVFSIALCGWAMAQEEPATFQVPDLSPPGVPDPSGRESIPVPPDPFQDDESIPAETVYPNSALGLLDGIPVPCAHPSMHLWAGYCDGCETLIAPCPCPPVWASVDALWLKRQGPDDYLLATDGIQDDLRNDQFSFDYEAGIRITYGEVVHCTPVEITYFGLHDWDSSIELDSVNPLNVPGAPINGVFAAADDVEVNYASELHSIEFNVLKFKNDCLTWVTGVRYIDVEEDFFLEAESGPNEGTINITGDNRLLGLQAGADYVHGCNGWCYTAYGRAGLFVNFAERDITIRDPAFMANNDEGEAHDTELAFVGQLGVGITRHLGCGLKLRGGYEVMWIDGLVLAAEQLGTGGAGFMLPAIDPNGDTLFDGGYVGLEWNR